MKILTGSWFSKLPPDHIKIGISRGTPRGLPAGYRIFKRLAPGSWFHSVSPAEYDRRYTAEILSQLDPLATAKTIYEMGAGKVPVLCCYENPLKDGDWCHRSMAAAWLGKALGYVVAEFGYEDRAQIDHPLLPAALRALPHIPEGNPAVYVGRSATVRGYLCRVIMVDPDNPGQAVVDNGKEQFSATVEALERYFGAAQGN